MLGISSISLFNFFYMYFATQLRTSLTAVLYTFSKLFRSEKKNIISGIANSGRLVLLSRHKKLHFNAYVKYA